MDFVLPPAETVGTDWSSVVPCSSQAAHFEGLQYPQAHPHRFPAPAGGLDVDTYRWPPTPTQGFTPAYQLQPPFTNEMPGFAPYEPAFAAAFNGGARPGVMQGQRSNNWQYHQESHGQPEDPLNSSGRQLAMTNAEAGNDDPRFADAYSWDPTDAAGL